MPSSQLATVAAVQTAIMALLTTYEPEFIRIGHAMFVSFAVILIVWHGIMMMFNARGAHHGLSGDMFDFTKLLFFVSFGYALIAFYEAPLPGIGVSFSNLITDQASYLSRLLDARALDNVFGHLDALFARFVLPDTWGIASNLMYWSLLIVVTIAKAISLGVVAYGLIASAVCALVGPLFVCFFIVPQLDWLFWGWLKAFVQYSFIQVIAMAWLMVGERFVYAFVTTVPPGVTEAQYPLYLLSSLVVVGTFAFGILAVPALTGSIFSGHMHGGGGGFLSVLLRK